MAARAGPDGPPVWQQYQRFKRQHPDALLLFRMGDFYETFDDDAHTISRELEITLTSREMGKGQRHPLAGVPYHALDGHLARLVTRGYRVAIAEQTSDPAASRGLVERAVTRVVTPGTIAEPSMLDARANNYLAAVVLGRDSAGLAYLDATTGEFHCCEPRLDDAARRRPDASDELARRVAQELERIGAAEVLVPSGDPRRGLADDLPAALASGFRLTPYDAWRFGDAGAERLRGHYGVQTLEGFGCAEGSPAAGAAGALVQYLSETAPAALGHLAPLRTYELSEFMTLDAATRRNLELTAAGRQGSARGSLLTVLDRTRTALGARLLRRWLAQPLLARAPLEERLNQVEALVAAPLARARLGGQLAAIGDLERLVGRCVAGTALPRELVSLRQTLAALPALRDELLGVGTTAPTRRAGLTPSPYPLPEGEESPAAQDGDPTTAWRWSDAIEYGPGASPAPPLPLGEQGSRGGAAGGQGERAPGAGQAGSLASLAEAIQPHPDLAGLLARALLAEPAATASDGGVIAPGYASELDDLVESTRDARTWMASLEARERDRTGLRVLKVGYNRVFGYYIEVTAAALRTVRDGSGATFQQFLEESCGYVRKQTLVGAERYITPELKEKESLILEAQERISALEARLYRELLAQVAAERQSLLATAAAIARLDAVLSLAEVAGANRYVRPLLTDGDALEIVGGRHPVVEGTALESGFVPNDTRLAASEEQIAIITGPNMAGKSTYLRQVGLIVLLAQIGSFVPADHATIGLVDRIFTRVGAQDDIASGQSTFMVEMAETANILNHATARSLVILDEIGRGTSTYDGMAIARAIVEHLHESPRLGCKALFATHYHELTELASKLPRVRNMRVDVLEDGDRVVFLHRVVPGGADRSYGVHVARLAGIPDSVTHRARELLRELESGRPRRAKPAAAPGLFDPPRDPLLDELASLQPDGLTPLQALNKLYELRDRARLSLGQ